MSKNFPKDAPPPSKSPPQDINKILEHLDLTADLSDEDLLMMEQQIAIAGVFEKWRTSAAAGNTKAVAALCLAAKHALMGLEAAGEQNVKPHATTQSSWPVLMIPKSRAARLESEAYLKRIGVGSMSRRGASSLHLVKTPREIKDVAALLFRFVELAGAAVQHRNIGNLIKTAVIVGAPEVENKNRRLGNYLEKWGQLELIQLKHLLNDLHRILELPPSKRDMEDFREIAIQSAQLPEIREDTFNEWFQVCQKVLVLIHEGFFLPGAKLRGNGQARAKKHLNSEGRENDSAYRDGILLNLKDALRTFVGLSRTGPQISKNRT